MNMREGSGNAIPSGRLPDVVTVESDTYGQTTVTYASALTANIGYHYGDNGNSSGGLSGLSSRSTWC